MNSPVDFTGPVNLGNPKEFTIIELAEKILSLTGSKAKVIFKTLPQDDPRQRKPDIGLAKSRLSWQPKIKLNHGLKETIVYFKHAV
jgi:UDP-glucuronate decarboxylase